MITKTASWRIFALAFLVAHGLLATEVESADPGSPASQNMVRRIDFNECEPVTVQSKIMEVRPDTGAIVVVERELRDVDVESGDQRIRTSYLNREGKPESRDSFRAGQYVRVEGVLHPDGYIAAFVVQEIEKPVETRTKYKPVELSKKNSRKARTGVHIQ
ncbi:MAG: hypothetical protein ACM3KE_00130 [Hyphomicrobiales bacterium]